LKVGRESRMRSKILTGWGGKREECLQTGLAGRTYGAARYLDCMRVLVGKMISNRNLVLYQALGELSARLVYEIAS